MGLMHDNGLIPAGTLIVGSPEETEEDVIKTIDMVEELRNIRSLIVPLFFVPMGMLKNEQWFEETHMTQLHQELLIKCLEHDFYWVDKLIDLYFSGKWQAYLVKPFYRFFVSVVKRKTRQAGINVGKQDD
jgi:radical SAM superfamily enzyme YgiQ (UPF0313 family)